MSERIQELVMQIQHSARAIDRDIGLLYEEINKREAEHPGQPVGWGNEAEDKFVGEE